jgi:hypothetical protein
VPYIRLTMRGMADVRVSHTATTERFRRQGTAVLQNRAEAEGSRPGLEGPCAWQFM